MLYPGRSGVQGSTNTLPTADCYKQMKVFRHHDVSMNDKTVPGACFFEDLEEKIATFGGTQSCLSTIAATGYKVQFLITVVADEPFGHPVRVSARREHLM